MKKRVLKTISVRLVCVVFLLNCLVGLMGAMAAPDANGTHSSPVSQQSTRKISGLVKDQVGDPIIGANIFVKGSTQGVITGLNGDFQLDVPQNGVVVISYIGYLTQEITITNQTNLNILLIEDTQKLEEIVILGYGAQTRKSDLSASIGIVKEIETLKGRPVASTESMLQGQIPGVTVVAQGGDPTATPSIVIRGQGSTSSEKVLWVVDGVPGAPLNTNDIESIVVLKDAASAAIYGAHSGSAGVILVTTKKAKAGKPSLAYEGSFGVRQASNLPQSLTIEQQRQVVNTSYGAAGQSIPSGWDPSVNPEIATTRTDWMDEVFRNAIFQRHDVSLNVGTEDFTNRISLNYTSDEGTLRGTYKDVLSMRYNGSYKLNKYVTISEDFMYRKKDNRGTDTSSGYSGVILSALYMPRSAVPYYEDGSYGGVCARDGIAAIHGDVVNPLRTLMANTQEDKTNYASSSTILQVKDIIPGLKFTSRFTYRYEDWYYKNFTPISTEPGKPNGVNELSYETAKSTYWETENTLTYDNTFGKHSLGALFSTTADQFRKKGFTAGGRNFNNENEIYQYLNYASTAVTSTDYYKDPDNNVALIGRLSYSYDNRYFVTASWRRDYAGRLPEGKKSGDFPAITAGWKISEESFFPKNDVLTFLKMRASWGRIGNLGSIATAYGSPTLSKDGNNDGKQVGKDATITTNLLYLKTAYNSNLTWETSEQTDLGLDMNFLKDRLSFSMDFFYKRTVDLIQSQTSGWPNYMGVEPKLINQGEIRNRGFEFMLNWNDNVTKDFSYTIGGNLSLLKNWVEDIGVTDDKGEKSVWAHDDGFRGTLYPYQTAEGQPLYTYYVIKTDGIFQSDSEAAAYVDTNGNRIQPNAKAGDLKFIDQNGDGKIDTEDRVYMGSYMPKVTFSLMGGFTYKKLTFSMMLQGAAKTKVFNASQFILLNETQGNFNRWDKILDAWSPSNTGSNIPRISKEDANGNFETCSDFYLEDASYLRIKNVTLAYDLTDILRKATCFSDRKSALTVYASGENLYTFTGYSGIDPEVGGKGLDAMKYPVSRVLSLGIKLTY
ncbi:TonB-dependent receptor [Parabacteroides sp. PF5-6]|uniref:SusC/RagA family TonB-linked outer membrane protein n=1 Tax=Parabacteroides sp. PF5-6 TaxID=1742403 RepID=UPI002406EC78|nr:TonB-dependent receptor [Parabacteroides sp. PF5-6]MDF9829378.1 TonB-linked SusC/RagA family outer membrane protein [Parabacteroides sp. PF5-6]